MADRLRYKATRHGARDAGGMDPSFSNQFDVQAVLEGGKHPAQFGTNVLAGLVEGIDTFRRHRADGLGQGARRPTYGGRQPPQGHRLGTGTRVAAAHHDMAPAGPDQNTPQRLPASTDGRPGTQPGQDRPAAHHQEQGNTICRYIIWRNKHAADERLRQVVPGANGAWLSAGGPVSPLRPGCERDSA